MQLTLCSHFMINHPLTCSTCTPASHHDINITTYQHTLVLHPFFARLFSRPPWRTPPEATTASLLCLTLGFLVHRTIRFLPFSTTSCLPASHPVTLASLLLPSAIPRLLPLPAAPIPSTLLKIIKYQLTPVYLPLCLCPLSGSLLIINNTVTHLDLLNMNTFTFRVHFYYRIFILLSYFTEIEIKNALQVWKDLFHSLPPSSEGRNVHRHQTLSMG